MSSRSGPDDDLPADKASPADIPPFAWAVGGLAIVAIYILALIMLIQRP
jgi:hypothetical protein